MSKRTGRVLLLAAVASFALTACVEEVKTTRSSQPADTPPDASQQTPSNAAPTIIGSPATAIVAGTTYIFQAIATDSDGNQLTFAANGLPAWMALDAQAGTVHGTPSEADVGTSAEIVVSVSDGKTLVSLPAFRITVTSASGPPQAATGAAMLSWLAPTQNTDGSAVTNLGGYRVYHGTTPGALNDVFQVAGAATTSYTVSQLAPGTHYFAVAAYTSAGVEGAISPVGSKTIL
jgi:hypothetical protein